MYYPTYPDAKKGTMLALRALFRDGDLLES